MPRATSIAVVVSDQHSVVRRGIIAALSAQRCLRVVGEASNGREAVRMAKKFKPDVVMTDIPMPLLNGIEAARQIIAERPETRVLLFSAVSDPYHIEQAMRVKVSGYLDKSGALDDLPKAVMALHNGKTFFSANIQEDINLHAAERGYAEHEPNGLTPRQIEVLQLIAEGFSLKGISEQLDISQKTADKHRQDLMKTLDVRGIAGLTAFAIRAGYSQGK